LAVVKLPANGVLTIDSFARVQFETLVDAADVEAASVGKSGLGIHYRLLWGDIGDYDGVESGGGGI
jgi:hypothetical protein